MQTLSTTRQSGILAMFLLLVILTVTLLRLSLSPYAMEIASSEFMPQVWEALLSGVLLFVTAVITNRIAVRIELFNDFCALPLSLFAVIGCGIFISPHTLSVSSALLLSTWGLLLILRTLRENNNKELPLFGGILFGTALLCYPPAVMLAAILPLAAWIVPLNPRQSFVMYVGYLLPTLAASYVAWYCGNDLTTLCVSLYEQIITPANALILNPIPYGALALGGVVAVATLLAVVHLIAHRSGMLANVRKGVMILCTSCIASLAMVFVPSVDIGFIAFAAVPMSILIASLLNNMEDAKANILYLLVMLLTAIHLFLE